MARGPGAGPVTAGKLRLELWCVELLVGAYTVNTQSERVTGLKI